ncbi:RNA 2',3'-cyclic phosphodiesterase [Acidocella aminolytica]|jgi:2'-5' RNA ligase|uniref:RNA 2',3'-cyclic phosphodiesterase n=1 Tax=Acidocella aminolytica 101 = DSM 11237 TaxID=1120923 RepID=A0A0D6PH26_9PROT|nr:RNA 2',3'-cyclic phosphodiesterase [Acidocella aminolytica]GAN80518.1 2'-5' RNA ligase [Acidocella aminolytica 101 = DSM 11237]GBQ37796.1 2'-5' RNA ligase [Acidocella aminolytica 101 = DSM 11237]SHF39760.1 2'-5' RNA ligase [Acidocella aminolytica 101 = DSM 11237]
MRLFVALDLPWEVKEELSELSCNLPGARWVPEENFHLTLRFIGEANRLQAEEIDHALNALRGRGFFFSLSGLGWFEKNGRINTLYAGVERNEALARLQAKVETALHRVGLAPERRRFIPHVTLARMEMPVSPTLTNFVQANNLYRSAPIRADNVTLFSSLLGKDQPTYTPEAEYALA